MAAFDQQTIDEYRKAHPNVTIKERTAEYADHHKNLAAHLATNTGAADIEAVELGYTGNVNNRATLSAAIYWTRNEDEIFFTQNGRYRATSPPADRNTSR